MRAQIGLFRSRKFLFWLALVLAVLVPLWIGFMISEQKERAISQAQRELGNIVLVLAEQVDRVFESVDLVQKSLIERIQSLEILNDTDLERFLGTEQTSDLLKGRISGLPQIDAITIVNARGKLITTSRSWPSPQVDISDRNYFKAFAADPRLQELVSEPVINRGTGTGTIFNVRRLNSADGKFLGLVLGVIRLDYFKEAFRSISLGQNSAINLFRADGTLLARNPDVPGTQGMSVAGSRMFGRVLPGHDAAVIEQVSLIDGINRYMGGRKIPHYPLVVTVSNSVDSVLAQWRNDARSMSIIGGLFECLIAGCAILTGRHFRAQTLITQSVAQQVLTNAEIERLKEKEIASKALDEQLNVISRQRDELSVQSSRFEAALQNMSQGIVMVDAEQRLVVCNRQYLQLYNTPEGLGLPGTSYKEILLYRAMNGFHQGRDPECYVRERMLRTTSGVAYTNVVSLVNGRVVAISHSPMPGGGWVSTHEDVTLKTRAEEKMAYMAKHDALTALPNRTMFRDELLAYLAASSGLRSVAVHCVDLDHFKSVNDSLGHLVGDGLLRAVACRLRTVVGSEVLVCRMGGDEFALVQRDANTKSAGRLAKRVINSLRRPFDLADSEVVVGASVGIAISPADGSDPDELMKNADLALYTAKDGGRGRYCYFKQELEVSVRKRRQLETDLRKALPGGEFELHYQPLIRLQSLEISGFEALLRWRHPERGMISPAEFIPVAEETGLIAKIGEWVLREACIQAETWPAHMKIAVNLSPVQFRRRGLVSSVRRILEETGLDPGRLELEITETVLLQDESSNLSTLRQLRDLGIRFALDDFGTGFSSLSYLSSFPFDKIKIDKSFVQNLSIKRECQAIVRAVADLACALGMATTAEGIETQEQLENVREKGCTEGQGFLFSAAKPASEIPQLLSRFGGGSGLSHRELIVSRGVVANPACR
jgi:diguanylate cyclase (GGDEF)-like protein